MAKPSLEFQLKPTISSFRWLKRLPSLHRPDKLLLGLYLLQHQSIECLVLSRSDRKQVLYNALALYLQVSVFKLSAVHTILKVA